MLTMGSQRLLNPIPMVVIGKTAPNFVGLITGLVYTWTKHRMRTAWACSGCWTPSPWSSSARRPTILPVSSLPLCKLEYL